MSPVLGVEVTSSWLGGDMLKASVVCPQLVQSLGYRKCLGGRRKERVADVSQLLHQQAALRLAVQNEHA